MAGKCLDSWAVIELLNAENTPPALRVAATLDRERPVMSWLNAGEVFYIVRRRNGDRAAHDALRDLRHAVEFDDVTAERVVAAARIKSDYPIAFADAFAAATAIAHDAVLLTGDPELLVDGAPWQWEDLRDAVD
jgi:predicted nucleic acid-binding protein